MASPGSKRVLSTDPKTVALRESQAKRRKLNKDAKAYAKLLIDCIPLIEETYDAQADCMAAKLVASQLDYVCNKDLHVSCSEPKYCIYAATGRLFRTGTSKNPEHECSRDNCVGSTINDILAARGLKVVANDFRALRMKAKGTHITQRDRNPAETMQDRTDHFAALDKMKDALSPRTQRARQNQIKSFLPSAKPGKNAPGDTDSDSDHSQS